MPYPVLAKLLNLLAQLGCDVSRQRRHDKTPGAQPPPLLTEFTALKNSLEFGSEDIRFFELIY
jgi:hypothetical protein